MKNIALVIITYIWAVSCTTEKPVISKKENVGHILPSTEKQITSIAFSSCCKQDRSQQFWTHISEQNPDLWIWGGDNIYSDTEDRNVLNKNYKKLKEDNYYQAFIAKTPVIGVWDDHDYGARDSGEEYVLKEETKEEFMLFFDIPNSSSIRNHKGIYTSYELGEGNKKIKIYLLDCRTFKTELTLDTDHKNYYIPDSTGSVLGIEQWKWLKNEIGTSNSTINIFVSGIQIIPDEHIYEKWGNFPKERQRFLDLLESTKVKNPIIISGDRHFAEFSEYSFKDSTKVVEFTASGMTHSYEGVEEKNKYRVGKLYDGKNFGVLEIDRQENTSTLLNFILHDIHGSEISKRTYIAQ